jgi:hypothetical protein
MKIIPTPQPSPPDPAKFRADNHIARVNSTIALLVQIHKDSYKEFWNDPKATPAKQLEYMGSAAGLWLASASTSVQNIMNLVNVAKLANPSLTLDDFLPPEWRVPRLEFVTHPDGTVTLKMKEGYDEWGNLIPPPTPEPETESDVIEDLEPEIIVDP